MDLEQIIENLTDAQKEAILSEELPAEIEKEAAAEVAEADLQNAFYAYGALQADMEIEAEENDGLSKEASERFDSATSEIEAAIDQGVQELELDQIEDTVEMHKVAMASAALIFEGYCDQMEKLAKGGKGFMPKVKGVAKTVKKHFMKGVEKAKELGESGVEMAKKHKTPLIGAASAAAGYGAGRLHAAHKKEASELVSDPNFLDILTEAVLEKQAAADVIVEGIEKLAARGKHKAGMLAKAMHGVKAFHKKHLAPHAGKTKVVGTHALAAGAGGLGGYMAHKMKHRKEK